MKPDLHQLFNQLQSAKRLKFIRDIDSLVMSDDPVLGNKKSLFSMSDCCSLDSNVVKLYIRFDPSVSMDKIRNIQEYVEKNFGLCCKICSWSVPTRLDIDLNINI